MRNKFLTKILGATLGIAMAIGVGAGVASFVNREAKPVHAADSGLAASDGVFVIDFYDSTKLSSTSGTSLTNNNYLDFVKVDVGLTKSYVVTGVSVTGTVQYGKNGGLTAGTGTAASSNTHYVTFSIGSDYAVNKCTVYATAYEDGRWKLNDSVADSGSLGSKGVAFASVSSPLVWDNLNGVTSLTFKKDNGSGGNQKRLTIYTIVCEYGSGSGSEATITSVSASLKPGSYYAGNTLSASDFNVTVNWSEGDPTHPTSGFTWTVNGEENGALVLGENTIVVTYQEQSATIENFEATRDPRWVTSFSNTKVNAITLPEEENVETNDKYYVTAKITAITSSTYGNGNAVDEDGTAFAIFGMYNFNGSARYDSMIADQKPVAGDIVVLYGAFVKYSGAPEIKNAWLVQHNGNVLKQLSSSIDLTTDNTFSKSASMVAWGNPETPGTVGMLLDKGTSQTDANNYLGGAHTSTRFYNGQTLVVGFNPAEFKMVKIIFTATSDGYASTFAGSTFDNATAVANSTKVTVTVTKGTQTVTAHVTGTCGFVKVEFVYEEASAQQKVECGITTSSAIRYNYVKNGENDFTITDAKIKFGGYVTKALWDELNAESPIQGYGVMISTADLDPDGYIGDEDFKTEYAIKLANASGDVDAAISALCDNTKIFNFPKSGVPYLHEAANEVDYTEDTYAWNLVQSVNSDHLTRTYVAIAYIRTSTGLVFLEEERTSVRDIADRMVNSGDYDGSPLYESLDYLSNL